MRNSLGVALRELTKQKTTKNVFSPSTEHEEMKVCECFTKGENHLLYDVVTGEYKIHGQYCNPNLLCVHIMKSKHQAKIKTHVHVTPPKKVTYQASITRYVNQDTNVKSEA